MPKLKVLSVEDVVKILLSFGFEKIGQRGSHVKLRGVTAQARETMTIPMHREVDRGLLRKIYTQGILYIPESELKTHFYTDVQ